MEMDSVAMEKEHSHVTVRWPGYIIAILVQESIMK